MADNTQNEQQGRVLQQDITPGVVKPRHLVSSPLELGDLYYSSGTDFVNLPIGTEGFSLISTSGVPAWSLVPVTGITPGSNNQVLTTLTGTVQWAQRNADYLSTTTTPVNVSLAAAPTSGQVLTATSATTATWQTPSSGGGTLFTQTQSVTVANTLTETTLVGTGVGSATLTAGFLTAGKTIRITMGGVFSTDAVFPTTLGIRALFDADEIVSNAGDSADLPLDLGATTWMFQANITCRSTGATGTVIGNGFFTYRYNDTINPSVIYGQQLSLGVITIDTTVALDVIITVNWGDADTDNTITAETFVIESLN